MKYDPTKLHKLNKMFDRFEGREDILLDKMKAKYMTESDDVETKEQQNNLPQSKDIQEEKEATSSQMKSLEDQKISAPSNSASLN